MGWRAKFLNLKKIKNLWYFKVEWIFFHTKFCSVIVHKKLMKQNIKRNGPSGPRGGRYSVRVKLNRLSSLGVYVPVQFPLWTARSDI